MMQLDAVSTALLCRGGTGGAIDYGWLQYLPIFTGVLNGNLLLEFFNGDFCHKI